MLPKKLIELSKKMPIENVKIASDEPKMKALDLFAGWINSHDKRGSTSPQ